MVTATLPHLNRCGVGVVTAADLSCLDRLLGERRAPRRPARNHRDVAEAVHFGWADAGFCMELTRSEAGLVFFPLQEEGYDLCFPGRWLDDPRLQWITINACHR